MLSRCVGNVCISAAGYPEELVAKEDQIHHHKELVEGVADDISHHRPGYKRGVAGVGLALKQIRARRLHEDYEARPYNESTINYQTSVANASDARESMMRLTHSICTARNGELVMANTPIMATRIATTLTVSWN